MFFFDAEFEKEILKKGKIIAARNDTSISGMIGNMFKAISGHFLHSL